MLVKPKGNQLLVGKEKPTVLTVGSYGKDFVLSLSCRTKIHWDW